MRAAERWKDYELLDASRGERLERWGDILLIRPDPQVLKNIRVTDKTQAQNDPEVKAAVAKAAAELGDSGRILLRESGTEPLVRVMVEGKDFDQINALALELAGQIKAELNAPAE